MPRLTLALIALLLVMSTPAQAEDRTITCTAPTKNTDDSLLVDLLGFRLYGGLQGKPKNSLATAPDCRFVRTNLATGVQEWYVTALSPAGESAPSATTSYTVVGTTPPPTCPAQPAAESRQQACLSPTIGSWTQSRAYSSIAAPACWEAGPWTPDVAPAGVCASPAPLKTSGTYAYCVQGTTAAPTMTSIGYVEPGESCGPATRTVGAVKFCQITRKQADKVIFCKGDETLSKGVWSRAQ